jgi:hypothetical protein
MSRNPTPLGGVAKRERAPVVGAWFFDVIDQKRGDCPGYSNTVNDVNNVRCQ